MILRLSDKQWHQLHQLCMEFQPYMPFEEIVFMEVVRSARIFCDKSVYPFINEKQKRFNELLIGKQLAEVKAKFYFNGIKANKNILDPVHYMYLRNYVPRVKTSLLPNNLIGYNPIEKVLFIKIIRACRDFMRSKMSKDAEQAFFEKLSVVYDAIV